MTKRILVGAVFLAGCAVGGASSQLAVPKASAQQAASLPRWEYTCFVVYGGGDTDTIVKELNARGSESWELVDVGDRRICFKRPKM